MNTCGGRLWKGNFTHIWNASGYDPEITALTNVINEYRPGLESGSSDPETDLPKFLDALNGAGADVLFYC